MRTPRPSPAFLIALLALVVALSGTAYAAVKSQGDAIIKKSSLSGNRLKANTVKGTKINESSLAQVPTANHANTAGTANLATSAPVPPLNNYVYGPGWKVNTGFTSRAAGYRKDISGFVHLQGMVERSSGTGTVIATLPPGYRPTDWTYFPVYTTGNTFGSIYIQSNGEIIFFGGDPSFVSLEGVVFYPDR